MAQNTPTLYCDLDGTLVDFHGFAENLFGRRFNDIPKKRLWPALERIAEGDPVRGAFSVMPWLEEGRKLWAGIADLNPTILTGCPSGDWSRAQKQCWCARELGQHVPVICTTSSSKHRHAKPGDILVDDRIITKGPWESAGGIFILFDNDAASALEQLASAMQAAQERAQASPIPHTTTETTTHTHKKHNGKKNKGKHTKKPQPKASWAPKQGGGD
eukprot:TRINITY_DN84466_c0_g1_i1.p1 TRINITY_DN84466_c0_g1~~TRINITY_DN84466_c0_g1_i1.p1  ORF type:complete len:216 (-),score=24.28 TRINITY_DN84466_c0_g1_i1:66-713(-)